MDRNFQEIKPKMEIKIPLDLFIEYKLDPRIVLRHPWIIGMPIPEMLIDKAIRERFLEAGFELMIVPTRFY